MNGSTAPRGRGRGRRPLSDASSSSPSSSSSGQLVTSLESLAVSSSSSGKLSTSQTTAQHSASMISRGMRPTTEVCVVRTVVRQTIIESKQGTGGAPIDLLSNYFPLIQATTWKLYQYHATFNPVVENKKVRKALVYEIKETFGKAIVFDGFTLTSHDPISQDALSFTTPDKKNPGQSYTVTLSLTGTVEAGDTTFFQFFNNIMRKCLFQMGLTELGRNFFDSHAPIDISAHRITLWPGFVTSTRQHDGGMLLCVEATTKVLRLDSVLHSLENLRRKYSKQVPDTQYENAVKKELVGSIVMSSYNKKTYKIADVDFQKSPKTTFERRGQQVSFVDYYKDHYEIEIKDFKQPLLLVEPKKQDFHRAGGAGAAPGPCLLIPELCQMTGLTDEMRQNFNLMKELSKYLFQGPEGRIDKTLKFMKKLQEEPKNAEEFQKWGLKFGSELVPCKGRILDRESIVLASPRGEKPEPIDQKADWTMVFRKRQMLISEPLDRWAIIVPQRDNTYVPNFIQLLNKVSTPIGFMVKPPSVVHPISESNTRAYLAAIKQVISNNPNLQLLFVVLANNRLDNYAAVKKELSVVNGIPSQCFLAKNLQNKGLMSIATKVAIQMNAKLRGQPWSVPIPLKKVMVVGFDVHHGSTATKGKSVGALVSSTGPSLANFFSTVSFHSDGSELAHGLCSDLIKCVEAYKETNGDLPERIMLYRDGVGDGQLQFVQDTELNQVLKALENFYAQEEKPMPRFTFIIVCKRINTRLFTTRKDNPPPGTVCDGVVTLPERYDFFLIPQTARQGAVSPSSYNVIFDSQKLQPGRLQQFTYKMCHLYFNWSGTIAVPAPCKYAHKLASQIGTAIGSPAHDKLNFNLHYL